LIGYLHDPIEPLPKVVQDKLMETIAKEVSLKSKFISNFAMERGKEIITRTLKPHYHGVFAEKKEAKFKEWSKQYPTKELKKQKFKAFLKDQHQLRTTFSQGNNCITRKKKMDGENVHVHVPYR
jgi:hypothetical protein